MELKSSNFVKTSSLIIKLYAILTIINLCLRDASALTMFGGHYHHNKRQQPSLTPTLTLDVEPHPGIQPPSSVDTSSTIPDYYFPVEVGLFNFTCTIKHPSFKYKLTITREQVFNNGERSAPLEFIDVNDYQLNTAIQDNRISVEYSEPVFSDPSVKHLRVSLLIKGLTLQDNGVYTCKYSNIIKKINTIVYKQATLNDITYPVANVEKLSLNVPTTIECLAKDIYPKPKVGFKHSNKENVGESAVEKDVSEVKNNDYYLYSVMSSLTFTPSYLDNNQNLECVVTSFTSSNSSITKQLTLQVSGTQIIEEQCKTSYPAKVGDADLTITCVFFSNPSLKPSWELTVEKKESTDTEKEAGKENEIEASTSANKFEIIKIDESASQDSNFAATLEESGSPNSGLFVAKLKIKEVRVQDITNYTFKLENLERIINVVKEEDGPKEKDLSILPTPSGIVTTSSSINTISHSKHLTLFMISLVLYMFKISI